MAGQGGIVLRGVSVAVRGKTLLSDISLSLTEARVGIVGRNGSGKTTLLRVMSGLAAPDAGEVRVDGTDPADRKAMLGRVGILFQNPDHQILFPTVAEELAFGLRQMGLTGEQAAGRVAALLSAEGRAHWADAPTATLSQGQKQWLCLMAVLLMEPATLLLDEPFAGLDLPMQARLARRLAALPQRIVTVSHDPAALRDVARVVWIEGGRIVADGTPDAVLPEFQAAMARLGADDADADLAR